MRIKLFNAIKVSTLAILLTFGLSFVYAWTAPTQNPPAGNVSAPINTSATLQQKSGDLTVQNFLANTMTVGATINANAITAPKFCIGASCVTAWPVGGITSITGGACSAGQVVTSVSSTGVVTCGAAGGTGMSGILWPLKGKQITCSRDGMTATARVDLNGNPHTKIYVNPLCNLAEVAGFNAAGTNIYCINLGVNPSATWGISGSPNLTFTNAWGTCTADWTLI